MSTATQTELRCYHCGQPTPANAPQADGHRFCCEGCQTVYRLLQSSGLCAYYSYETTPGTADARTADRLPELAYLDDETLSRQLLSYRSAEVSVVELKVPGMHCLSCLWLLEQLGRLHPGVRQSEVNLGQRTVRIRFTKAQLSLRGLVELLHRIGYPPVLEAPGTAQGPNPTTAQRRLVGQIGLAGFALGNTMLLALPDYLEVGAVGPSLQLAFNLVSFLLSGLVLYASRDYFRQSYYTLRLGRFAIEQPLVVGIVALWGRSVYEVATQTGAGYFDSLAGLVFFLLVGKWLQQRTFDRLQFERDFRSYFPLGVTALTPAGERTMALGVVKPGDRLVLRGGELVPTDSFLLSPEATFDYSFLTGEATPVLRTQGDLLYAGGRLLAGRVELLAEAQASTSRLARLWERPTTPEATESGYTPTVNRLARYFTLGVLAASAATLAYWLPRDPSTGWLATTGLLIIACPCALAFAAPFALGTLQARFGATGFFLRSSRVVEGLAHATDLVFDKTGTLTDPEGASAEFVPAHGPLTETEAATTQALAATSAHPLSRAVAGTHPLRLTLTDLEELPGSGLSGYHLGVEYRLGQRDYVAPCTCQQKCKAVTALADAPAETRIHLSIGGKYRGYYRLTAQYLPGVFEALTQLAQAGYALHLLSGDGPADRAKLAPYFAADRLRFEQRPEDKLAYIEALKAQGKHVAYLGDGLNDGAALTAAHTGVAITGDTALFTPASKGILLRGQLTQLGRYLRLSRAGVQAVRITFGVSLVYNLIGASFAVQGLLSPVIAAVLMPAISIGSMALATGLAHLALGREPITPPTP
ncbi:MAG: heavy metal translocating P-type ATPase metal-binding domain-containing protein [Bacteroidia bacterium]|nr:heavy metal translocating P-type ATPase metal-binding domain-containing protein [Bacteroidia bacterium]